MELLSKKVYCIIVTYNGEKWIEKCLSSLQQLDCTVTTIVVDNGSVDRTIDLINSKFPAVILVQPQTNLGFGKGNNVGIEQAINSGADFIFLLNQDAYWLKGSMLRLLEVFERNPMAGLVSPLHLAGDEKNIDFGFYKYVHPDSTPFLLGELLKGNLQSEYETSYVNAAAWLLKRSTIENVGMFHPIFDHYGEDREYVSRLTKSGFSTLICTECCIVHNRPQNRSGNVYHNYGQNIARELLQGLVEKSITYTGASKKLFSILLRNLFTMKFGRAKLIFAQWLWLRRKKKIVTIGLYGF